MAVLNARASRFGIDNSHGPSLPTGSGDQFFADGPNSHGSGPFNTGLFHFDTAFSSGNGHGWYKGSGFTFAGAPGAVTPTSGTVTSLSVDFLGGSSADITVYGISLPLVDLFNGDHSYFVLNVWNGNDKLKGSDFSDSLYGYSGNDVLLGYAGNDLLSGGTGNDYLNGGVGDDILHGGVDDDTLVAGRGEDSLYGGSGNDKMRGGKGGDFMSGGTGNDVLHGDRGADQMFGNAGNDRLLGGTGADEMHGGTGDDVLLGGGHNDNLYGEDGNDVLDGGAGVDYMNGGAGNDTYIVDEGYDEVIETAGNGIDKVVSSALGYQLSANVENLVLKAFTSAKQGFGNASDNTITGNENANLLVGLGGDDFLFGRAGVDTLIGGDGNDYLDGGTGTDTMSGGLGNDRYVVRESTDLISEDPGQGTDTVISFANSFTLGFNVENIRLHQGAGNLSKATGNDSANRMYGNDFDNTLYGGGGNDRLFGNGGNDVLVGGALDDYMAGGTGNDFFFFEGSMINGDDVIADFTQGSDRLGFTGYTFADLTISSVNGGVMIDYGVSDSIFLAGVGAITLGATDFLFV